MYIDIVAEGLGFPEGPVFMNDGSVLFVEISRGTLSRLFPDGKTEVIAEPGGGPNGAAIGPDGAVYICNNGGFEWHDADGIVIPGHKPSTYQSGSIQRVDLKTGRFETLYDACDDQPLSGPNDIVFDRTGNFWFTDHGKTSATTRDHGALYYAHADGSRITRVRPEMLSPNGVGLSPDESVLYVADTLTARLWAIDLAAPGEAIPPAQPWLHGRVIATLPEFQLLDSLKTEANGSICVGTIIHGGVTVFQPNGTHAHIPFPDIAITNIVFGGENMQDVWATGSSTGRIYKTRWPRPGLRLNYYA